MIDPTTFHMQKKKKNITITMNIFDILIPLFTWCKDLKYWS